MRRIKIGDKMHLIDISDGKGSLPFGMNGGGGMSVYLDGTLFGTNCHFDSKNGLDGTVKYKHKREIIRWDITDLFTVDEPSYDALLSLKNNISSREEIEETPVEERIAAIKMGLKLENIRCIDHGYRFGKELTFDSFCITFDQNNLVAYTSYHNGYIAPDIISLSREKDASFSPIYWGIRRELVNFFK